ncbi:hypothetical protein EV421DRAFT_1710832 [Armillaria borealis]|uniref:GST N-terminal domain-containing protein n=1 Tax=Armillaria borealis TaxID=47425 RepID=A0AA39MQI6_9AGAR|nr:hypothetical protein EV421DRAFT_1710832 [Armillaria borealis]
MSSKLITLYDIPTKLPDAPGSLTTWQARYSLNMKNVPYQTVFVELPDIEPLAKRIGAAPTGTRSDGITPLYTVPIIQDHATGAVVAESAAIAAYLDKAYPSSGVTLIPTGTRSLQLAFRDAVSAHFAAFHGFMIQGISPNMNDRTVALLKTRLSEQGINYDAVFASEGKEKVWEKGMAGFSKIDKWFEGNEGPFIMGSEPFFSDTILGALLRYCRATFGKDSKEWKNIVSQNGGKWVRYLENFAPYEAIL